MVCVVAFALATITMGEEGGGGGGYFPSFYSFIHLFIPTVVKIFTLTQ